MYIYEPTPLKEGEEKHVISVFVADEAGLINRVAGVFARRGAQPARRPGGQAAAEPPPPPPPAAQLWHGAT